MRSRSRVAGCMLAVTAMVVATPAVLRTPHAVDARPRSDVLGATIERRSVGSAPVMRQAISVTRPAGALVIAVTSKSITVTDTRAEDAGWTLTGVSSVLTSTSFRDGRGAFYRQVVDVTAGTAKALPNQGLGISTLLRSASSDRQITLI